MHVLKFSSCTWATWVCYWLYSCRNAKIVALGMVLAWS